MNETRHIRIIIWCKDDENQVEEIYEFRPLRTQAGKYTAFVQYFFDRAVEATQAGQKVTMRNYVWLDAMLPVLVDAECTESG